MSAKGGITKGKSHAEGGIPMVVKSTGQQVELEGGEGVINKRNMASTKTFDFEGKKMTICEIASKINSADGNGVQIDCDNVTGTKYKYEKGGKILNEDEESEFKIWFEDGNVIEFEKGVYSTQDAQYSNKLKGMDELRKYFRKEFLSDNYQYSEGGNVNQELKMDYDFRSLLLPNEKQFFLQNDTKAIQHKGLIIFTDGKREIVFSKYKTKLKKLGNASKSTKELYDKYFADGGYVDLETYNFNELRGKYVNLHTMGVELPTEHQIVDITLTSPQFRYRYLTLKFDLGNAKIKFEDIEDFLNEKIVFVKTDKEEFGVQLIPNQFAKGGRTKNAMKLDDYENASISLDSYEEGTLGANPTEFAKGGEVENEEVYIEFLNKEKGFKKDIKHFNSYDEAVKWGRENFERFDTDMIRYKYAKGGFVVYAENEEGYYRKISEHDTMRGAKTKMNNVFDSGEYEKVGAISSEEWEKNYAPYQFKEGGEIDLPKANKMFHLPLELAVYVPSTQDVNKVISDSELKERVDEVSEYLARLFGGFTKSDKIGGFMASNSELVTEDVVPVVSFATKSDFNANKEKLVNKLSEWAKRWGQEAIGFEFEGDLYYVPEKFANGGNINKENYGKMTNHKYAKGGGVEKHKYVVQWLEDDNLNTEYYYSDEYEEAKELYYQIKYDLGDSQYKKVGINIMDIETGEVVFGDEFEYAKGGGVQSNKNEDINECKKLVKAFCKEFGSKFGLNEKEILEKVKFQDYLGYGAGVFIGLGVSSNIKELRVGDVKPRTGYINLSSEINPNGVSKTIGVKRTYTIDIEIKGEKRYTQRRTDDGIFFKSYNYGLTIEEVIEKTDDDVVYELFPSERKHDLKLEMGYIFANGGGVNGEKVFEAQEDGILGVYSGSDAYTIEISKGDRFKTFGKQDNGNWWFVKKIDIKPTSMMLENTFDYRESKSNLNVDWQDLVLTFPKGENSIYAEMKEVFANGGGVSEKKYDDGGLTRGQIEDKIEGLKLRIAKTKKQISLYETTQRGKYNKLFQEKVVPLQKELYNLSELWGKAKYSNGGDVRDMSWYKDFKKQELKRGTQHEMEHIESIKKFKKKGVSDREVAKSIAKDHLDENENYYIELDKMKESSAKVSNALQDFDHQKSKRKNSRKYKLGGYMGDNKSVNVHIKLTKDHDAVVRSKDGTYLNDVNLKKDKVYKFGFLFDEGQNVAFDLGNDSDSYILIPSSIVVVVGYDEEKMELGGEVKSYAEYQLDRNDKSILKLLLKIDPLSATAEQRDKVSTFKGNNRVNDLSPKLIQKIYGILFKNHNIDNQIKNLYLTNIGAGNILLYAPNYLEKTIVGFDEKNEFVQVEKEIANIVTLGKRATLFNEFELSDIDGFIHVYPKSNPEVDNLCEIFYKSNKKAVAVGVCEFTSREKLDAFQRSITINQGSMALNQMISFAKANDYLIVKEGITSEGQYTLIYTMTKY